MYNFRMQPFPYQLEVFEELIHTPYKGLFLEQGLGKSKICLDAISYWHKKDMVKNVIVVTDKVILSTWQFEQIPQHVWDPKNADVFRYEASNKKQDVRKLLLFCSKHTPKLKILLVHKEAIDANKGKRSGIRDALEEIIGTGPTALVLDESTFIKNIRADRTKAWSTVREYCDFVITMTGTPAPNSPLDWLGQMNMLNPSILNVKSETGFKNKYCKLETVHTKQSLPFNPTKVTGLINEEEFFNKISPFMVRLKKEQVQSQLPPKVYQIVNVDLNKDQETNYNQIKAAAITIFKDEAGKDGVVSAKTVLTEMLKLQTISSGFIKDDSGNVHVYKDSAKQQALQSIVDDGQQTIVWCRFRQTVETLLNQFPGSSYLYGGMTTEEQKDNIARFKNGQTQLLITMPQAGLTLNNCSRNVYYENSFNYEHRAQSEDRTHRIGQEADSVQYIDLIGYVGQHPTVDLHIKKTLDNKAHALDRLPSFTLESAMEAIQ